MFYKFIINLEIKKCGINKVTNTTVEPIHSKTPKSII